MALLNAQCLAADVHVVEGSIITQHRFISAQEYYGEHSERLIKSPAVHVDVSTDAIKIGMKDNRQAQSISTDCV
jgi:hypothetical protein